MGKRLDRIGQDSIVLIDIFLKNFTHNLRIVATSVILVLKMFLV